MNTLLPEPKRYLDEHKPIYGLLEAYEVEDSKWGKSLTLSIRDAKEQLHKVSIKISGGQAYATIYGLLKEHDLPFGVDISESKGMIGREIKYVKTLQPKK